MAANPAISANPSFQRLEIKKAFDGLTKQEKLYAHHLSRAAWHGARIILRQVSPESESIFDFILELYSSCEGDWQALVNEGLVSQDECEAFLGYAATFLSNIGNFYGSGDQKFVPDVSAECLQRLASKSETLLRLYEEGFRDSIRAVPPHSLGYPGPLSQSAYYPSSDGDNGDGQAVIITPEEVVAVSRAMEERGVLPENTRIRKVSDTHFEVLQASAETDDAAVTAAADTTTTFPLPSNHHHQHHHHPDGETTTTTGTITLLRGDHSTTLNKIITSLEAALPSASNDLQRTVLRHYIESFRTGSLEAYRESQRAWIRDKSPRVENIFGFVEPYRDPHGTRAEFEGLVAISDPRETARLARLAERSDEFIRKLPWAAAAGGEENGGKGPFEKALFEAPDFTSIHTLAYCSSIVFAGINLPNYNDIRQTSGFKNVIIANRMAIESSSSLSSDSSSLSPFVDPSEAATFQSHKFAAYYLWVVLHELLGHGTGKMLQEEAPGVFNFDNEERPPVNPLTGRAVESWYGPGQTWTGQFGDLATTVDECRAELVGAYLMDDEELLGMFGFGDGVEGTGMGISAEDLTYNLYLQLGVDGLRGLANFNVDNGKWGQAHSRAHFAILKCLLTTTGGSDDFMTVTHDADSQTLTVRVDRSKIRSHGKPALGRMLLRLHMYRSTADVAACRSYYDDLSRVDGVYLAWREVVLARRPQKWVYVQPNTVLEEEGEVVTLREYEASARGVVRSWAERGV